MKGLFFILICVVCACNTRAQTYADSIAEYRKTYTKELLEDKRAPVKPNQVGGITFFRADSSYRVWARVKENPGATPFLVETHSGKKKPFREYGTLTFRIHDSTLVLHVYQMVDLMHDDAHKDDLFLPFNDLTNYETTYAGGRYLDLSIKDIQDGKLLLDFNKCYNPYCAYAEGYSCPIPPVENRLQIELPVGERMFTPNP